MNVSKLKLVRIEKKKAFLIKSCIVIFLIALLLFLIINKVQIHNANGNLVICFKKIPQKDDKICYESGKNNKIAIFDSIRNDGSYRLYSLDKKIILGENIFFENYKGIVKITIPFVFSLFHSKLFLLLLLIVLIFLYRKNEELYSRKLNRKHKKNEIS